MKVLIIFLTVSLLSVIPLLAQDRIDDINVNEDDGYTEIVDLDDLFADHGDNLEFQIDGAPEELNLTIDEENVLGFTPADNYNLEDGVDITIIAINEEGDVAEVVFNISVTPVNDDPFIVAEIEDIVVDEDSGETIIADLDDVFGDIDDDELTIEIIDVDEVIIEHFGLRIDEDLLLSVNPEDDYNWEDGTEIGVEATDAEGLKVANFFHFSISPVNDAPMIADEIADIEVDEDSGETVIADLDEIFFDIDVADAQLSFEFTGSPDELNMMINDDNWLLINPDDDYNLPEGVEITVTATDGEGLTVDASFNLVVSPIRDDMGDIIDQFNVGEGYWIGLAWDGELMWGIDTEGGQMIAITPDGDEVRRVDLPLEEAGVDEGDEGFGQMCWDGEAFWIACYYLPELFRIDRAGNLIDRIELPEHGEDQGAAGVAWDGEFLWYLQSEGDGILRQITVDGRLVSEVDCSEIEGGDGWLVSIEWVDAHQDGHIWWHVCDENYLAQLNVDGDQAEIVQEMEIVQAEAFGLSHDGTNLWYQTTNEDEEEWFWYIMDDGIDEGGAEGQFETEGTAWSVTVSGDYVYVADGENGVVVLTRDEDGNLVLDNHWEHPEEMEGDALSIVISDDLIYLADGGNGLVVLSKNDNDEFVVDAHWEHPEDIEGEAFDIAVSGELIYVADGPGGVVVLARDDDGEFFVVNQWGRENEDENEVRDIIVSGEYIYVANGADGFIILTENDDGELVVEAEWTHGEEDEGGVGGIAISGENFYLADEANGLVILARDGDGELVEVNHWEQPEEWDGYAIHVAVVGDFFYLANETSGLVILTEDEDGELVVVERFESESNIIDVVIDGNFAYAAEEEFGVRVFDVSEYLPEPAPRILVTPLELEFGEVEVGESLELTVTIRNIGNADLEVEHPIADGEYFTDEADEWASTIIEPDDFYEVFAIFSPEEVGEFEGRLIIPSDDPDNGEVIVQLTGVGVEEQIVEFVIPLNEGWNLVSAPVEPVDPNMIAIWSDIVDREHLILVKSQTGDFYSPGFNFNQMDDWDVRQGYQAKLSEDDTLIIVGRLVPEDMPIPLVERWNIAAYLPEAEVDPVVAFANIEEVLIIAKDVNGNFYHVEHGFSNMPDLSRTNGYQVKVTENVDLVWNVPDERAAALHYSETVAEPVHFTEPISTGSNMSMLLVGQPNMSGMEVAVVSGSGETVGAGRFDSQGRAGIAVWGDDPTTNAIDGLEVGDHFELVYWDEELGIEIPLEIDEAKIGNELVYKTDGFSRIHVSIAVSVPNEYFLSNAYPNPFNGSTRINFGLPEAGVVNIKVHDISGRTVASLVSGEMVAGRHSVSWSSINNASGVYILRLDSGEFHAVQKIVLTK